MEALYIVTGAAGHLGNTLLRLLDAEHRDVRALVLPGEPVGHLPPAAQIIRGDVCVPEDLARLFENPKGRPLVVIHAAGIVSIASRYDERVHRVNVEGTRRMLAQCQKQIIQKFIYVSSVHAIPEAPRGEVMEEVTSFDPGRVVGLYARTKAEATQAVLDAAAGGLPACVVHPSGIVGPYDYGRGHITQLVIDYVKGGLTSGIHGGYDFVDVRDVADGILACSRRGRDGACYILSNRYYSVREILTLLQELTGGRRIRSYLPSWFIRLTAPLAELYYRILRQPPLFTGYSVYTLEANASFSHARATRELDYHPRPLRESLKDTIDFLREQGRI